MPHAYAFVDPLFSTGIAWSLRAVERLALSFESAARGRRVPDPAALNRYDAALRAEADQIDLVVAGAYEAMAHFDLFAAQAMLYFATVSFAEASQRLTPSESVAWNGFLGVGDPVLEPLARESLRRLREITERRGDSGTTAQRQNFAGWIAQRIAPRNIAGLAEGARHNLYPVDFDVLIERHALLGVSRDELVEALPTLRGTSPPKAFVTRPGLPPGDLAPTTPQSPFPSGAAGFGAMRDEAGISRLYGGIHYPSDIEAGKVHGNRIATYTLNFAQSDGAP